MGRCDLIEVGSDLVPSHCCGRIQLHVAQQRIDLARDIKHGRQVIVSLLLLLELIQKVLGLILKTFDLCLCIFSRLVWRMVDFPTLESNAERREFASSVRFFMVDSTSLSLIRVWARAPGNDSPENSMAPINRMRKIRFIPEPLSFYLMLLTPAGNFGVLRIGPSIR